MKNYKLTTYFVILVAFYSCSPKLNLFEIEEKINKNYLADFEGNVEYMLKVIPVKDLKKNGIERYRKILSKIYNGKRKYPVGYSEIGELNIKSEGKCDSYVYYDTTYLVTKSQMTPYIDSTALELNYKEYGKKNVFFNPNSKILHITERKHVVLVFDKDRNWKIIDYNIKSITESFGEKFSKCIQSKVNESN